MINHLKKADNILIASHIHPDGDAIGSLISLGLSLASLGKNVTLFNECPVPKVYRFLTWGDNIINQLDNVESFDTAIILDCADFKRIGDTCNITQNFRGRGKQTNFNAISIDNSTGNS